MSVDVPDLKDGIRFYAQAFGVEKRLEPVPRVVVMRAAETRLCLLEKREGTRPADGGDDCRRYFRHWTSVHTVLHMRNLEAALAAGAQQERLIKDASTDRSHFAPGFLSDRGTTLILSETKEE
jgi:hypothetical protein